jgi:hypothetical protein
MMVETEVLGDPTGDGGVTMTRVRVRALLDDIIAEVNKALAEQGTVAPAVDETPS